LATSFQILSNIAFINELVILCCVFKQPLSLFATVAYSKDCLLFHTTTTLLILKLQLHEKEAKWEDIFPTEPDFIKDFFSQFILSDYMSTASTIK
jgi:hypothetical protein